MRVIAGRHRGRTLASFSGERVRPTADRVKESLFQILSPRLVGARTLDLFSGSGALGIEALSRGAAEAVFNDISRESVLLTKKNLDRVGETASVLCCDFRICLERVTGQFDLIFADPPYREDILSEVCAGIRNRQLLKAGGLIVYESEREETPPAGFSLADRRSYGRTTIYFLEALP